MTGDYPCCDGPLMLPMPDMRLPVVERATCEHCGAVVWHQFSRVDPKSWTDEQFRDEHHVDDETKSVRRKTRSET